MDMARSIAVAVQVYLYYRIRPRLIQNRSAIFKTNKTATGTSATGALPP